MAETTGEAKTFGPETFVSVIMPVYNAEAFVAEAIQSVLAQTHGFFELIIVDDGSPDASAEIVQSVEDPRIRFFAKANGGVSSARNAALRETKGDVIALIDSDDRWEPEKLEKHLAHFAARPDVGISYCPSPMMGEDGTPVGLSMTPKLRDLTPLDVYCGRAIQNGSSPVFRREAFDAIAFSNADGSGPYFFDENLARYEDFECWMRMALNTPWKFEGIETPLTWYRLNPHGLSANTAKHLEGWLSTYDKIAGYAPKFIAEHGPAARAYAMRNFARRAVRARDGKHAWTYATDAVRSWPAILWEEPGKSVTTVGAAGLMRLMPKQAFTALEGLALRLKSKR